MDIVDDNTIHNINYPPNKQLPIITPTITTTNSNTSSNNSTGLRMNTNLNPPAGIILPPRTDLVKIALSLYKVQQNIYLLDFQHIEVSIYILYYVIYIYII